MEGRRGAGLWVVAVVMGGEPRTVPATDFKLQNLGPHLFTKKKSERQTVRREGMGDQEKQKGRQGRRREGRKKPNNGTKECVIKTGNGRREEGSGGFQKEAGRGRFSRERRSGADTRAV